MTTEEKDSSWSKAIAVSAVISALVLTAGIVWGAATLAAGYTNLNSRFDAFQAQTSNDIRLIQGSINNLGLFQQQLNSLTNNVTDLIKQNSDQQTSLQDLRAKSLVDEASLERANTDIRNLSTRGK